MAIICLKCCASVAISSPSRLSPVEAMEFLQKQMNLTDNNEEFLATMNH